jgi:hypothetical protein
MALMREHFKNARILEREEVAVLGLLVTMAAVTLLLFVWDLP